MQKEYFLKAFKFRAFGNYLCRHFTLLDNLNKKSSHKTSTQMTLRQHISHCASRLPEITSLRLPQTP